jgi:hypothetical protein
MGEDGPFQCIFSRVSLLRRARIWIVLEQENLFGTSGIGLCGRADKARLSRGMLCARREVYVLCRLD